MQRDRTGPPPPPPPFLYQGLERTVLAVVLVVGVRVKEARHGGLQEGAHQEHEPEPKRRGEVHGDPDACANTSRKETDQQKEARNRGKSQIGV
jgi:hypothetical protein